MLVLMMLLQAAPAQAAPPQWDVTQPRGKTREINFTVSPS